MKHFFRLDTLLRYKTKYMLYILVLVPFITEFFEDEDPDFEFTGLITEIVISVLITVIVFIIIRQFHLLENLSLTDHLTGISNRRQFEMDIKREVLRSHRLSMKIALIFFDLDGFKMINDTYGHKTGDMVLTSFAESLSLFTRKGIDFCYRFGGDEFAVMLTNITRDEEKGIEERIEQKFSEVISGKLPHGVSASKGVVMSMENESWENLIARADMAMYDQKMNRKR